MQVYVYDRHTTDNHFLSLNIWGRDKATGVPLGVGSCRSHGPPAIRLIQWIGTAPEFHTSDLVVLCATSRENISL